jgi:hypothetical protein
MAGRLFDCVITMQLNLYVTLRTALSFIKQQHMFLQFCVGFETIFPNMNYSKTIVEIRWFISLIAKTRYQFYDLIQWKVPV